MHNVKQTNTGLHGVVQVDIVTSKMVVRRGLDVDVAVHVAPSVTASKPLE